MTLKRLPTFGSEAEEAAWWYENREKHDLEFAESFEEGRVQRGGIVQRLAAAKKAATVTIGADDALRAVILAEKKGIGVEAYLNGLLHDALAKELELYTAA